MAGLQLQVTNRLHDLGREVALALLLVIGQEAELGEHGEVVGGAREEVIPWIAGRSACAPGQECGSAVNVRDCGAQVGNGPTLRHHNDMGRLPLQRRQ